MQNNFSTIELVKTLLSKWYIILICAIIGSGISWFFMNRFIEPSYISESQMIVNQTTSSQNNEIKYTDIQTSISLINTYRDIITSQDVLDSVINELKLGDEITVDELEEQVSVYQTPNSQSFIISAIMNTPQKAQDVVNRITREFEAILLEIFDEDISNVYILADATFNPHKIAPSTLIYLLLGALIGFLISSVLILMRTILDNRVNSSDILVSQGLTKLGELYQYSNKDKKTTRFSTYKSKVIDKESK